MPGFLLGALGPAIAATGGATAAGLAGAGLLGGAAASGLLGGSSSSAIGAGLSTFGNIFGANLNARALNNQAQLNYASQKEFAQNAIRWRVADAKAAGLHPLFALQGTGATYTPSPLRGDPMGQGISRSAAAWAQAVNADAERRMARRQARLSGELLRAQSDYYRAMATDVRMQTIGRMRPKLKVISDTGQTPLQTVVSEDAPIPEGQVKYKAVELPTRKKGHPETRAGLGDTFQIRRAISIPGIGYLNWVTLASDEGPAESLEGWGLPISIGATAVYWMYGGIPKNLQSAKAMYRWYQRNVGKPIVKRIDAIVRQKHFYTPTPKPGHPAEAGTRIEEMSP